VNGSTATSSKATPGTSSLGIVVVLVLVAIAVASQLVEWRALGWAPIVLFTFVGTAFGGAYLLVQKLLVERLEPAARGWRRSVIRPAAAIVVIVAVFAATEFAARWTAIMGAHLDATRRNFYLAGFCVTVAAAIIDSRHQQLRRRARELELREERARRQATHAELSALRARTDPHFLFNSLNTVAGLIEEDPRKASEAVERLAGLFRYALDGSRRESVRFGEEVRAVETYLAFETLRFGDRFTWRLDVDRELLDAEVPPLFLQPLVENAVIHAAAQQRGAARVEVRAARHDGRLRVEVEDDGGGMGSSRVRGSGTAMTELRERLELLYGGGASLRVGSGAMGGVLVTMELP
jgi:two-component system sensor histidine kinase AlgZ